MKNKSLNFYLSLSLGLHLSLFVFSYAYVARNKGKAPDFRIFQLVDINQGMQGSVGAPKPTDTEKLNTDKVVMSREMDIKRSDSVSNAPEADLPVAPSPGDYSGYVPSFKVAQLPQARERIIPAYPANEKALGKEAEVLVEVYIDEGGNVRKVVVLRSGGQSFDEAIREALGRAAFTPAIALDGKRIPVKIRIPFKFELE